MTEELEGTKIDKKENNNEDKNDKDRHQKVERLLSMNFENHREFLTALVAIESEALGINFDEIHDEKKMKEWLQERKSRLVFADKKTTSSSEIKSDGCRRSNRGRNKDKRKGWVVKEKKKGTKKKVVDDGLNPGEAAEMPQELLKAIMERGGLNLTWVGRKPLYESDVRQDCNRLSLPKDTVSMEGFLTDAEKMKMENNELIEVEVVVMGDKNDEPRWWHLNFKRWVMNSTFSCVSINHWWQLVQENDLKEDDIVQLWCFRVLLEDDEEELKLCFAINIVRKKVGGDGTSSCTKTSTSKSDSSNESLINIVGAKEVDIESAPAEEDEEEMEPEPLTSYNH